ncbi:MAG: histidine kinase dimerization/phospho-acceptor domain-containing protein [Pseudomonadota bacterium]
MPTVKFVIYLPGEAPLLGLISLDMTEKVELEKELRQSQKLESIGQLAGGIAHDFNIILASVIGFTELLIHEQCCQPSSVRKLHMILDGAQRGAGLVNQLLAFSRKQPVLPQLIDPAGLVTRLHEMLVRLIGEDISLDMDLAENIQQIHADTGQIEQIIIKLVANARDAIHESRSSWPPTGGRPLRKHIASGT